MGAQGLGSRAIIGNFYNKLETTATPWVGNLGFKIDSDQSAETIEWLGQVPAMREFIGGRDAKGFSENGITIVNKKFEATLEVLVDEIRRDKTGQVMVRIAELAQRTNSHWASLISTLILNGASGVCYDGQYFFDTDHTEGKNSTNQSNKITVDVSDSPVSPQGIYTSPSPEVMCHAIFQAIQTIYGFKDNENEPLNETASNFLVMVPTSYYAAAMGAANALTFGSGGTNVLKAVQGKLNVDVITNPRLSAWTDKFAVFRTDGETKPFVLLEEEGVTMSALAEGSEEEFKNERHLYGVKAIRNVGYGMWQHACQVTLVA